MPADRTRRILACVDPRIHIQTGDLTTMDVDAIVNAANNDLLLGGGLAGAIRSAGGPDIQEACTRHGPVAVGEAACTTAGNLPARYVIHQASMQLGGRTTPESLERSTQAVLDLAEKHSVRTLAFPATGTGIAGFPMDRCAQIMLHVLEEHLQGQTALEAVYFVLFETSAADVFNRVAEAMDSEAED